MTESPMDETNDWLLDHENEKKNQLLNLLKAKEKCLSRKFDSITAELYRARYQSQRKEELKLLKQKNLDFKIAQAKFLTMKYEHLKMKIDKEEIISGNKETLADECTPLYGSKENVLFNEIYLNERKAELQDIEDKIHSTKTKREALIKELEHLKTDEDNFMC